MTTRSQNTDTVRTLFWCELVCRQCSATTAGQWVARQIPIRSMKREAAKEGWIFKGIEAFCCDKHLSIYESEGNV